MPLFRRGDPAGGGPGEDPAAARQRLAAEQARQERDQHLLESGRLPLGAAERLARVGGSGDGLAFSSDLAPDEAGLLRRHGLQPVSLVTGSCMYHVGIAYASAYHDCEVSQLSGAYNEASRLAVARMQMEAQAVGAHGVVGVRYSIVRHEWADKSVEVQVVGTAVRAAGPAPSTPWLCDLSGQDWWALHRAGYEPAALAYGHCTWFVLTTQSDEWIGQNFRNQEYDHFSQALSQCRTRAVQHMRQMARDIGALGVTGVHISRRLDEVRLTGSGENPVYEFEHHNLVLSMIGTAIRLRPDAPRAVPASQMVLSLRSGRLESRVGAAEAGFA